MEKKEIAQQLKVGAFVLTGVALFLVAVFLIGSQNNLFSKTFTLNAVFKNVEGLKAGDNVVTTPDAVDTFGLPLVPLDEQLRRATTKEP